jgi:hypothetical protein
VTRQRECHPGRCYPEILWIGAVSAVMNSDSEFQLQTRWFYYAFRTGLSPPQVTQALVTAAIGYPYMDDQLLYSAYALECQQLAHHVPVHLVLLSFGYRNRNFHLLAVTQIEEKEFHASLPAWPQRSSSSWKYLRYPAKLWVGDLRAVVSSIQYVIPFPNPLLKFRPLQTLA